MATLRRMAPETILQAITNGAMRVHAEDVTDDVKRAVAEYLSGRKLSPLGAGDARTMPNRCPARAPLGSLAASPAWNGWSPEATNARFQRAPGLSAADVPRLSLKWAFGFPGVSSVYGQPTVAGGRVFVGVDTGYVYALDAATGCVHWSFLAETGVRNAISVGPTADSAADSARYAAYFGDIRANVYAVNAETGELLWKVNADPHPLAVVTGSPTLYEGRSVRAGIVARRSRGRQPQLSLLHLPRQHRRARRGDRAAGLEDVRDPGSTKAGSEGTRAGPSSGPAPARPSGTRRQSIRATAQSTSQPATHIPSRRMPTRTPSWPSTWTPAECSGRCRTTENDAWLVGCAQEKNENCPADLGPDYDFGAVADPAHAAGRPTGC